MKNQKKPQSGKKNSLLIFLLAAIFVMICGVAGYTLYEMKTLKSEMASASELKKTPDAIVPVYVPLDAFTVSLKPTENENDRVLYIGVTLRVKDVTSKELLQKYMPEVRSRLLVLFAQKTAGELSSEQGRTDLIHEMITDLSLQFAPGQSVRIDDVLFNAFIVR
ncbi:hypothetical protein VL10_09435 [Leclercia adecarboxylata]|nr:hypothetical protein VL10_09435 [Leclercia adecarboxylata]KMN61763.1 hypothetical protein VK95_23105 [Leclercia sp. LK8]